MLFFTLLLRMIQMKWNIKLENQKNNLNNQLRTKLIGIMMHVPMCCCFALQGVLEYDKPIKRDWILALAVAFVVNFVSRRLSLSSSSLSR